jgi:hypothetical protein
MSDQQNENSSPDWQQAVQVALRDLRFGSVEITVHEGKVTQIERHEKIRLNQNSPTQNGRPLSHNHRASDPGLGRLDA